MLKKLSSSQLTTSLKKVGLTKGCVVHVQSDLRRIGPVDVKGKEGILPFYFDAFSEVIGEEGTLSVSTASPDYGRYGTPFIREESPSRVGVFSEYVRQKEGAIRSMHPIISTTAIGPKAKELCGGPHFAGYGWDSPWGRLHRDNAKILSFGLGPEHLGGLSFFHFIENAYGVPYIYNKLFTAPVYSENKEIKGPFVLGVRYLNRGILYDTSRVRKMLIKDGVLQVEPIGQSVMMCGEAESIFQKTVSYLQDDIYLFLKNKPLFIEGQLPMDGLPGNDIPEDGRGLPAQVIPESQR